MKYCHRNRKIPVVHLKRFSLVKIFALKIFTTQKFFHPYNKNFIFLNAYTLLLKAVL